MCFPKVWHFTSYINLQFHYYQLFRRVSKFDMFECCDDEEDDTEGDNDDMDLVTMFCLTPDDWQHLSDMPVGIHIFFLDNHFNTSFHRH